MKILIEIPNGEINRAYADEIIESKKFKEFETIIDYAFSMKGIKAVIKEIDEELEVYDESSAYFSNRIKND